MSAPTSGTVTKLSIRSHAGFAHFSWEATGEKREGFWADAKTVAKATANKEANLYLLCWFFTAPHQWAVSRTFEAIE
jgi:hypothetical protein